MICYSKICCCYVSVCLRYVVVMVLMQDIGAKFSKMYLQSELDVPLTILVDGIGDYEKMKITMKKSKGKNSVMITSGWWKVVQEYKIKEDEIWLFNFGKQSGGLDLLLMRVP